MGRGIGFLKSVARKLDKLVVAVFALVGGMSIAQFPQYLAQYLQRLGGHIDEARMAAGLFKLPALAERAAHLAEGLRAISGAPAHLRLVEFIAHAQWDIAKVAYDNFTPGITFTREEIGYLALGGVLGVAVYGTIKGIIGLVVRLARGNRRKAADGAAQAAG